MKKGLHSLVATAVALTLAGMGLASAADASAHIQATSATTAKHPSSAVGLAAAKVLVTGVTHGNLHVVRTFAGPGAGITGVVAEAANGHKMLAWMVDDTYLAPGPLLTADGQNLSMVEAQQQGLIPKPMASSKLAQAAMQAPGFMVGKAGPVMVVFLDPNCIFCHLLWKAIAPDVAAGKVRLKVVPTGFLKPSSFPKAVTIMMQKDPENAWAHDETHFNVHTEEGGTVSAKVLKPRIAAEIHANTQLLAKSGTVATPTLIACEGKGLDPVVMHGISQGALQPLVRKLENLKKDGTCGGGK
ncbi:thioredoxin fold domain-containing protein [Acidithiobacillus sp. MC6.1]|nr:thioredoxin fold domain-containing protein [Acidithiobacillus sp. MC6.1]